MFLFFSRFNTNDTQTPFITTDQPLINLKANRCLDESIEDFELYYPISPNKALILYEKDVSLGDCVNKEKVIELNKKMAESALEQIYANKKSVLKQCCKERNIT